MKRFFCQSIQISDFFLPNLSIPCHLIFKLENECVTHSYSFYVGEDLKGSNLEAGIFFKKCVEKNKNGFDTFSELCFRHLKHVLFLWWKRR